MHAFSFPEKLITEINTNPVLRAALCHRSARAEAIALLGEAQIQVDILDAWEGLGSAVLSLFSARLTLNQRETRSPGTASQATTKICKNLLDQLAWAVSASGLPVYGRGVTTAEKNSRIYSGALAQRLIGVYAYLYGYSAAVANILGDITCTINLSPAALKDGKTRLQEICQRQRLGMPRYEIVAISGPEHAQQFNVKVSVKGLSESGVGDSRRAAERHAATILLEKYYPVPVQPLDVSRRELDVCSASREMHALANSGSSAKLVAQTKLPVWTMNLFSLAFTHASYSGDHKPSLFGKDNRLLSFFGSYVLQWVARDCCAKVLTVGDIVRAGGLTNLVQTLLGTSTLAGVVSKLEVQELMLLGDGEKNLTPSIQVEFLQAFMGALFLAKAYEGIDGARELLANVPAVADHFLSKVSQDVRSREELLPKKTLFQERCQAIGIGVSYESTQRRRKGMVSVQPILRLKSALMKTDAVFLLNSVNERADQSQRKAERERQLATLALTVLDSATIGVHRLEASKDEAAAAKWLLAHTLKLAERVLDKKNVESRSMQMGDTLGVALLRDKNFIGFAEWLGHASSKLDLDVIENYTRLRDFYAYISTNRDGGIGHKQLKRNLRAVSVLLSTSDPLADQRDIRDSEEFRLLLLHATIFRLFGSPVESVLLSDIVLQARLLYKKIDIHIEAASNDVTIQEIRGAHLALISLIIGSGLVDEACTVRLSVKQQCLIIQFAVVVKESASAGLVLQPVWSALETVLPVSKFEQDEKTLTFTIPSVTVNRESDFSLLCWWSYHFKGTLGAVANDTIATMLHDLKNNLLGYSAVARNAKNAVNIRERYQLAAQAGSHLDHANILIKAVQSIIKSAEKVPIDAVPISGFMRIFIQNIVAWLPSNIALNFPSDTYESVMLTNQERLSAILLNLVRNASDAMNGKGTLTIKVHLDEKSNSIEFEVVDTGPGFSGAQLLELNRGVPVRSTKTAGQGIGLLTVLLLIKDLDGVVEFKAGSPVGASISVWIPMKTQLAAAA